MDSQTIGIIGGGQLGRMLTEAAQVLGFSVIVVDPAGNCPAAQVGADQIVAAWDDTEALIELAERSDYITIEVEHIGTEILTKIAELGKPVNPAPATIAMIQDKFAQKQFLASAGIPVGPFVELTDASQAKKTLSEFGGKMVIKTKRDAYNGRGNMVVASAADIDAAFAAFAGRELYAEQFIPFQKELAVMVARDFDGRTATYPLTETIHQRNICIKTLTPAAVDQTIADEAHRVASLVADKLQGAGVYGIEMFLTHDNEILVNEIAPRVHNSGHYTIEACETSQFTQAILAVTDQPLGSTKMKAPTAVMINILGEQNGPTEIKGVDEAGQINDVTVHLYGKSPTKVDRKMGHLTAVGTDRAAVQATAEQASKLISV